MWPLLLGCQEPFGTDRHDLVGFRLAAVQAPAVAAGAPFVPRAAVIVDGRAWAAEPAVLTWGFVADEDAALEPFEVAATGAAPTLVAPETTRTLVVSATHGGVERRAFLTLAAPPGGVRAPTGFDVGPLPLPKAPTGEQLVRDARLALVPGEGRAVERRGWLRLVAGVPEGVLVRFMATAGTFLELEAAVTDWTATDDLHLDEDEVDDPGTPIPRGTVTMLALAVADVGETAFTATEVFVGPAPDGVWLGSRFVPATGLPAFTEPGLGVRTVLREDAEAPSGLRLEGGTRVDPATVTDWGTPDLSCDPAVDGPLDPDWFLTQRCSPAGADGLEVVVVPSPTPPGAR
jgi:hypothetical protein